MPDIAPPARPIPRPHRSPHGRVTAVSMMKDEGPYLLEWVAHHIAVGFTDLVVYTNDCTDGTDAMLMRLEALGLAHHRRNVIPEGIKPQPSALKHAQNDPVVQDSDWVMVLDADEFLGIRYGDGTLDALIGAIEGAGATGMVITWRIFGSSGVQTWCRDFVTEQYRLAAPPMWNKGWGVKTLFRFDPDAWKLGIHRPKMKNRVLDTDYPHTIKWLNGSGREMEDYFKFRGWRSIMRTVGYDWAQMNHYAVKSIDSYLIRKFRGNVNNKADKYDDAYWSLQDRNEVPDDTVLRYSARRREIFDGLLSDPALNALHHAALARTEAMLDDLRRGADYEALVARLRAASGVPITRVEARPAKDRDPEAIARRMAAVEARAATAPPSARPARPSAPIEAYVREIADMSAAPALDWIANHTVELPCDPRVFTPPALIQIAEGKFERNLARNLPGMLGDGAHYVEIGAASGFVATHLFLSRPDLRITLQEGTPALRAFIATLWARNGVVPGERLSLVAGDVGATYPGGRVDFLALGDPALTPAALSDLVRALPEPPRYVALSARLWPRAFAALKAWEGAIRAAGCTRRLPVDPGVAAIYERTPGAAGGS